MILAALDRYFGLTPKNTSVKTEILAGLTTFVAMAYILFVNPSLLEAAGIPKGAAIAATIWSAAIGSIAMGAYANLPVAVAPGMSLNAFFTYYVCNTVGLPWQTALGAVFISGIVFLILTITKLRQIIIDAVPLSLKAAVAAGIGIFIAFVGLQSAGIIKASEATLVTLGHMSDPAVLLALTGIILITSLLYRKMQSAMLIGIAVITVLGYFFGVAKAPESVSDLISTDFPSLSETFMQMDVMAALKYGILEIIFSFTIVELFNNIGTLIAVCNSAGLMDKNGKIENIDKALIVDSTGTLLSAMVGTCAVSSYVESSTGAHVGGRTGLTAIVVGICFILSFIFAPLALAVPAYATAPVLIIVGALMMINVKYISLDDYTDLIPAFLTVIMMPLTYSIANGFGFGFTAYCLLKLLSGKYKEVHPIMWVVSAMLIISFFING